MTSYPGWAGPTDANSETNAIHFVIDQALSRVRTLIPVQVKAVSQIGLDDQYTVDAQPLINQSDGAGTPKAHGTVLKVPVLNLSGANGSVLVKPAIGDYGLMAVCDRDISKAIASKAVANPGSRRMHNLADGIYLGGFGAMNSSSSQIIIDDTGNTLKSSKAVSITAPDGVTITGNLTVIGNISNG